MKRSLHAARHVLTLGAALAAAPAIANPGLLHKHGHRALGGPMTLPGQASATVTSAAAGAAPAVATTTPSAANAPAAAVVVVGTAVAGSAAGGEGIVGVAPGILPVPIDATAIDPGLTVDGGPVCIMVPLGGGPAEGGAAPGAPFHIHHPSVPGAIGGSPGLDGLPVDGAVDPGLGDSGMVRIMPFPVDAIPIDGTAASDAAPAGATAPIGLFHAWRRGPGNEGAAGLAMATMATAAAAPTDAAGGAATAKAGGIPARAAGVRGESISAIHRHRPASSPAAAATTGPAPASAASAAPRGDATVAGGVARAGVTPVGAAGGGAAATPRWRDRLRVAWPGAK